MRHRIFKPLVLAIGLGLAGIAVASADFDASQLDQKYSPCQDFNDFVNAKWVAANPIPPDQTRWGSFNVLNEKSLNDQHALVEAAAKDAAHAAPGSIERKIGWLYASGMDEAAVDKAGFDPIKPELAAIAALKTPKNIIAWLQNSFAKGDERVFRFGAGADYKNAKLQIANADQGGLSLPTTDYYTKPEHKEIRDAYVKHVAKLFELTGVPAAEAAKKAANVLAFETRLAQHSIPRVEMRKPENQYHFVSVAEADKLTPHFDWNAFFKSQGVAVDKGFSLSQPKFFAEFDKMLTSVPANQWRDYLSAHTIAGAAPFLSQPFQDESFAFNGKTLGGQPEQQVRWKRVLDAVNHSMGQGLGQLYVAKYFPPEAKARAAELVDNVRNALKVRIEHLDWMSDATKAKAIAKWNTFLPKIGYPDTWRSWDGLTVKADDYFGNLQVARKYNYDYDIAKIGKPTDRKEWFMTPQTVNAYYNPTDNTINFPAAILQPPFFYADGDDAINYGGIGAVIGHEASHGFDDQGSQFDGDGNNTNWWTKEDREKFDARTQKLVDQFDAYAPIASMPDKHVNGRLTLGENIGDLGGINAAYDALQMALAKKPKESAEKIDGYTQDQRFFLNWARVWRGATRDQRQLVLLNADPHSPAQFRAIGAPSNMPAFAQAFSCKAGDKMVRSGASQVKIW
ncbi:MAG TPA: M13 family metallopeptidase [Rudaea sp.]|nr:M13 family metallopeptidase [Rudaea sp.]